MSKKKKRSGSMIEAILNYMRQTRAKSYKMKEISHGLHINKSTYHQFRDALKILEKQGKIVKLRNRQYSLPSSLQRIKGKIQITRKGFGFATDEQTGEEVFIPSQYLNTAFDGDVVEIQLFAVSRGKSKEGKVISVLERARQSYVGTFHRSEYYGFMVPDNPRIYRDFYIQPQNDKDARQGQKVVVEF